MHRIALFSLVKVLPAGQSCHLFQGEGYFRTAKAPLATQYQAGWSAFTHRRLHPTPSSQQIQLHVPVTRQMGRSSLKMSPHTTSEAIAGRCAQKTGRGSRRNKGALYGSPPLQPRLLACLRATAAQRCWGKRASTRLRGKTSTANQL